MEFQPISRYEIGSLLDGWEPPSSSLNGLFGICIEYEYPKFAPYLSLPSFSTGELRDIIIIP